MSSGGFRPNAGRKIGSVNKKPLPKCTNTNVRLPQAMRECLDAHKEQTGENITDYIIRAIEVRQAVEAGDLARAVALFTKPHGGF